MNEEIIKVNLSNVDLQGFDFYNQFTLGEGGVRRIRTKESGGVERVVVEFEDGTTTEFVGIKHVVKRARVDN